MVITVCLHSVRRLQEMKFTEKWDTGTRKKLKICENHHLVIQLVCKLNDYPAEQQISAGPVSRTRTFAAKGHQMEKSKLRVSSSVGNYEESTSSSPGGSDFTVQTLAL